MRRLALLLLSLTTLAAAGPAAAAEIVVFEQTTSDRVATETAERERDLGVDAEHAYSRAIKGFAAELTPEQEAALRNDPEVAAIIPDRPMRKAAVVPAQPGEAVPPGVRRVLRTPPGAVRQAATRSVAVLDSGVDLDHPDLNVTAGANCVDAGPPDDVDGHGTHVAGTIAAKDNGAGVVGVAPGTKILAVKVLDDAGMGTTATVLCGIEWVLAHRAVHDIAVANLSLGGAGEHTTCATDFEHLAYCRLAAAGITPVVAAGNDAVDIGDDPPDIPATYPEVLTVAAMTDTDGVPGGTGAAPCSSWDTDDRFASFSNYATRAPDLAHMVAAPGVCIRSTYPGGVYRRMSGTSMATPHVAGLVALCHGEAGQTGPCSGLTTSQIVAHMVAQAGAAAANGFAADALNPSHGFGSLAVLPDAPPATPAPADAQPTNEPPAAPPATITTVERLPAPAPVAGPGNQPRVAAPAPPQQPRAELAPPAPAESPSPRLTLGTTRLKRFLTRGVTARLTCAPGCRATVKLVALRAVAARRVVRVSPLLARATASGPAAAVVLKPSRAARRSLTRARRLTVTVTADVTTAAGTMRLRRSVTLT